MSEAHTTASGWGGALELGGRGGSLTKGYPALLTGVKKAS
jgi:hypothetical protein